MNGNNIYIEKNNLLDAYKKGNADNKKMLENLFGKEMFRPKNIMERIKTFDDAFKELGENHPLVKEYHKRHLFLEDDSDISSDLVAYLKLRIITAALNEGWTPQFAKDEYRYYPWFWLYTKEEIAKMKKQYLDMLPSICPKDCVLPVIEYESDKNYQMQFFTTDFLRRDEERSGSSFMLLGLRSDKQTGPMGFESRVCKLENEKKGYEGSFEVELFYYYKVLPRQVVWGQRV